MRSPRSAILLCALLAPLPAHALFSLSAVPATDVLALGELGSYALRLDATLGDAIVGFGLDLTFDPAVVGFESAAVAGVFDGINEATPGVGRISMLGMLSDPDASIDGTDILLATFSLRALDLGSTLLGYEYPFFDLALSGLFRPSPPGDAVLPDIQSPGSVTIQATVPAPASWLLLLPAAVWLRRRHRDPAPWHRERADLPCLKPGLAGEHGPKVLGDLGGASEVGPLRVGVDQPGVLEPGLAQDGAIEVGTV
jgi:hypothetical protein